MINLYIVGNENFNNNGDATLQPISAVIKKTINGSWSLEMELPYDEEGKYKLVNFGTMLKVNDPSVAEISSTQIWRIYDYKRNTKSVSVIAFPRAMESTFDAPISQLIIDTDVTGVSAASSLNAVSNKYTVTSNITRTARSEWSNTNLNAAICGTGAEAFVNVWGGEVVYDNLNIKILDGIGDGENSAEVMYGKNISEISYEVDDSGLTTRIYPLSTDGIRYWDSEEEVEYIDSPIIEEYPIVHSNYMTTPYKLVEDDANSISRTAQKTADIKSRIRTKASTLSHSIWNTAVSNGWKVDYMASIYKDIIANIQAMVTNGITHANLVKVINAAVSEGMAWMGEQEEPEWTWYEEQTDAWKYGSSESGHWAHNEWQYIDKKWCWFGDDYYWQQPKDDDSEWTWYENQTTHKKWYGTQDRYYLKGQYIYITEDGELKKYWLDGDGWYDSDKTDTSDWDWHESSSAPGAWWFGDEDGDNYMSGQWAFIDGTLYWFDDEGYYYGVKEEHPPFDWMESGEAFWFGNPDHTTRSYYLASQWAKIDRQWYRFDSSGYTEDIYTECLTLFHNGMGGSGENSLTTLVQTCRDECYALLYELMEEWSAEQFQNGVDSPTVTIKVDMVDLSKTSEYANYQNLETIKLGDTVKCVDYVHQIATTERVVELTYDLLRGYNTAITIGVASSSVGSMLSGSTGGGSSNVNNAINVDFIEQAIASKQAELNAGKNVTLTDNLDGTVTIDVDEPIRAGNHVTISKNSDGSYTVNADGGALDYWIEENQNFYRKVTVEVNNPYGWDCDSDYKWNNDGEGTFAFIASHRGVGYVVGGFVGDRVEDGQACFGHCMFSEMGRYDHAFVAVSSEQKTMLHKYGSGNASVNTFTYKGLTLYYSIITTEIDDTYSIYYEYPTYNLYGTTVNTGKESLPDLGTFDTAMDAVYALIEQSGFYTKQITYTGLSIGNNTAWGGQVNLIGNETASISDMDWFITKEGVFNGSDYKMGGVSINDIFQKILIAGNNIIIGEDGKTISAIDTTYTAGTNVQISAGNVISATDTTYSAGTNVTINENNEISAVDTDELAELTDVDIDTTTLADGDVMKYNSTSGKWENGTGGGGSANAQEISWSDYQALSQAEKENGTQYYIPDAPDSMAMPYLTMENGVPTLVFDDGE